MFIQKFNKLIRNKWIWGIFAVLVCFLFVASDMFQGSSGADPQAYGTLDGEAVTYETFQSALTAARVEDVLRNRGAHQNDYAWSANRAWRFVAALKMAKKMNLRVTKEELSQSIRALFSDESGFRPDIYSRVVLDQFHCTTFQFEAALKDYLLVEKTSKAFSLAGWVSEPLARAQSYGLTDTFTLRSASFTNEFTAAPVTLSDEKLKEFYDQNLPFYRVPEKVAVRYVTFKVADYLDKAEADSEEDLQFRYDTDPSRYTAEVDGVKTNLSFEAARAQLESESKAENAKTLAVTAAESFADAFYNDSHDADREAEILAPGFFEAQATAAGVTVVTTQLFSANAPVPGIERELSTSFSDAAFGLSNETSYECRSDAIVGKDAVYILAYQEKVAAHDPAFESIKETIVKDATQQERNRLFSEKLDSLHSSYTAEMQKGRSFDDVTKELGLTTSTNLTFSPMAMQDLPGDRRTWMTLLPNISAGKSSQFVAYDGGAALVYVIERARGEETLINNYKGYLSSQMSSTLSERLSDSWLEANFKGMNPVVPEIDPVEE